MRLPWDKNYFKIAFYAVITFGLCYLLKLLMDVAAGALVRIGYVMSGIGSFVGGVIGVFAPLVIGLVLAYILDPMIDFLQKYSDAFCHGVKPLFRKKISFIRRRSSVQHRNTVRNEEPSAEYKRRTSGAVLCYLFIVAVIATVCVLFFRKIIGMEDITEKISSAVNSFSEKYVALQIHMTGWGAMNFAAVYLAECISEVGLFIQNLSTRLFAAAPSAGSWILRFLLGAVLSFYFSKDKEKLLHQCNKYMELLLPDKVHRMIQNALGDIHTVLSGYIRGQLIDACIMSSLISVYLSLIGVDFAVVIGVVSGFSNLIPYFGALIGFVLSVTVAFAGGEPVKALYAAIGILVLQQIDAVVIVPKIVGKHVELGPIPVLLSLTVAGRLFGFGGLILAVPACAILKICALRVMERKKERKIERSDAVATAPKQL